jgi:hypothetical protein
LLAASVVSAQVVTGTIVGTITDSTGAVVTNAAVTSSTFGQVTSAHEPRVLQLGLKFNF